ncbi:hypothetical protein [Rubellicoccus peritrichatus]|uniref:PEP-CTERM protein-sorting domain-containing protein n=1 Tax=Rubellicoccus peritrichatus TaxID=3080537 RepID=A0AAQ3LBR7_9BACT|nr:hypothetical protein [Puniceicoccus sp. CR14]WOO42476.1 hypothetical protein RZN69_05195 [Puniceicoccus sp. CR14]
MKHYYNKAKSTIPSITGLIAASQAASAAVVTNTSSFTVSDTVGNNNVLIWDIDGNNTQVYSKSPVSTIPSNITSVFFQNQTSAEFVIRGQFPIMLGAQWQRTTSLIASVQTATFSSAANLASGYVLGTSNFQNAQPTAGFGYIRGPQFATDTPGYLGFRFSNDNGTSYHYGYAVVTLEANSLVIDGWAYESNADTAITVAPVPEPRNVAKGLAVLALGAAGIRQWRKRKQAS